jgi:hypothetical protein
VGVPYTAVSAVDFCKDRNAKEMNDDIKNKLISTKSHKTCYIEQTPLKLSHEKDLYNICNRSGNAYQFMFYHTNRGK